MNLISTLFDVISLRSFSNIWYWIVLALLWNALTQTVMGVPVDLLVRARREGGQAMADLEDLCRIKVLRLCSLGGASSAVAVTLSSMLLSLLAVTGFAYRYEFAQAAFLLLFPLALVGGLTIWAAHRMYAQNPGGIELCHHLVRLRRVIHLISLVSIALTAMWGMWRNLYPMAYGI